MAAFSRLQLAAALLEYDNDPEDPNAPYRSAKESAIFAHLRRNAGPRPPQVSRKSDYLGISMPSETASMGGRDSALDVRKSRASINTLHNPFGADETLDGHYEDAEMEVDLKSWGLDAFMPKDKGSKGGKGKEKAGTLPNPHPVSSVRSAEGYNGAEFKPKMSSRSMSLGNFDQFGVGGAFLESESSNPDIRRRTFGTPLDIPATTSPSIPPQRRRSASFNALVDAIPAAPPLHSIPFPTGSARSASPSPDDQLRSSSRTSWLDARQQHDRTYSSATMDSKFISNEDAQNRANRARAVSNASMGTIGSRAMLADDNPFALEPPTRTSKFDPKAAAHARTMSRVSMGSRMHLDPNDGASVMTAQAQPNRNRPLSTMELLRPKVLVMPSPLQPVQPSAPLPVQITEGFQLSVDGPPLPPAARTNRRASSTSSMLSPSSSGLVASNSFTPNPRLDLSLSQLTFRNTLLVGGQRDVAYADIDNALPRATEDGVQVHPYLSDEIVDVPVSGTVVVEEGKRRPPGKLYGKSLIDDLESRKAEMRGKQRVFTGDERPSMMARGPLPRSSTLIDPAALQMRPTSQRMSSFGSQPGLARRASGNVKPLLNFESEEQLPHQLSPNSKLLNPRSPNLRVASSRSVFGVDTIWEREMAKLKEMEAQEKIEAAERLLREEEEEARDGKKNKKGKGKGKGKDKDTSRPKAEATPSTPEEPESPSIPPVMSAPRISAEPPILPSISRTIRGPPPPPGEDDDETETEDSDAEDHADHARDNVDPGSQGWYAGSSDEEDRSPRDKGPRRTTGVGLRYPKDSRNRPAVADESDEEDLPLAATLGRAAQRATRLGPSGPDSDEEKPLSVLLEKTRTSLPSINFDRLSDPKSEEDEDNEPLGLRASRVMSVHGGDDDDTPLAFHPEQQRRSQFQMMAQQQQQQQMMMQAQMQNSMFFHPPSMIGSGFFGPPIPPMMMQPPPMVAPSPPPIPDAVKYGRVDRWRRDVAVEGEP